VPGHWEGDLIIGKDGKSAVGTFVERASRYVLLLHLPAGRGAEDVEAAMRQAITTLPGELFRTITWDLGKEMAYYEPFRDGVVCSIGPHSSGVWLPGRRALTGGKDESRWLTIDRRESSCRAGVGVVGDAFKAARHAQPRSRDSGRRGAWQCGLVVSRSSQRPAEWPLCR